MLKSKIIRSFAAIYSGFWGIYYTSQLTERVQICCSKSKVFGKQVLILSIASILSWLNEKKQVIFSHKTQRGCQHHILDVEICSFLKKYQQRASKLIHRYAEGPLRCWPGSRTTLNWIGLFKKTLNKTKTKNKFSQQSVGEPKSAKPN